MNELRKIVDNLSDGFLNKFGIHGITNIEESILISYEPDENEDQMKKLIELCAQPFEVHFSVTPKGQ